MIMQQLTVGKLHNSLFFRNTQFYSSFIAFIITLLLAFIFLVLSYETLRDIFERKQYISSVQTVPVGSSGDALFDNLTFSDYMRMSAFKVEVYYSKFFKTSSPTL
jgi:hypothetical protein